MSVFPIQIGVERRVESMRLVVHTNRKIVHFCKSGLQTCIEDEDTWS